MMILDVKGRILTNVENNIILNKFYLTKQDLTFLLALIDNKAKTTKEIAELCYGYYAPYMSRNISVMKSRILIKTNYLLDIKNIHGIGYLLNNEILIE